MPTHPPVLVRTLNEAEYRLVEQSECINTPRLLVRQVGRYTFYTQRVNGKWIRTTLVNKD